MITHLEAETADTVWLMVADKFRNGDGTWQESRAGNTAELLHALLCIRNPRQRWITSRIPALNPAFAFAEVIWILRGRNDSKFLNYFNRSLPKFAGTGDVYDGAYGYRLRNHFGIDQIEQAFHALKENPNTRQVVLQIWDSHCDLPREDGAARSTDVPCNICSMLKVRSGKLEWTQIMRSNDMFIGLPYNIIQFTTLHELMAGWLGLELGHYHHVSDSLHVYDHSFDRAVSAVELTTPPNNDSFSESYGATMESAMKLEIGIDQIIDPEVPEASLLEVYNSLELSRPWLNMGALLFAEGLRRRGSKAAMETVLSTCTNGLLTLLFKRWLARVNTSGCD
jgi:thymidylate synthase